MYFFIFPVSIPHQRLWVNLIKNTQTISKQKQKRGPIIRGGKFSSSTQKFSRPLPAKHSSEAHLESESASGTCAELLLAIKRHHQPLSVFFSPPSLQGQHGPSSPGHRHPPRTSDSAFPPQNSYFPNYRFKTFQCFCSSHGEAYKTRGDLFPFLAFAVCNKYIRKQIFTPRKDTARGRKGVRGDTDIILRGMV